MLLLPKFEAGELSGDFPGEAQLYYETYLAGGQSYEIPGGLEGGKLWVKDGVALYVTGMGKVNAALSTAAVLSDARFDFSGAYVISTGCGGAAAGYGVMGDVYVISAAVDFDLGHHADPREMTDPGRETWFREPDFDAYAVVKLDEALTGRVYELVKDLPLSATDWSRAWMAESFDGAAWALREPRVLRGTAVTADNYWKGEYDHRNALRMTADYGCPDPYAVSEMEDAAIGRTLARFGLLDRFIILRTAVNMDVFLGGATPESLRDPEHEQDLTDESSAEAADIFAPAMGNVFAAGSCLIDAILRGELG